MTFIVKDWKNSPDTITPLNADALKDLESRLSTYTDNQITATSSTILAKCKADGLSDDTQAILDAIALAQSGNKVVELPAGTIVSAQIPFNVELRGQGRGVTILKLKDGTNSDFLKSSNFDALVGTDSTGGISSTIRDLTIDANKAGNPTGGDAVKIYGFGFAIINVEIRNAKGKGLVTEWSGTGLPTLLADGSTPVLESSVDRLRVHNCDGGGIDWNGSHDSVLNDVMSYRNGGNGIRIGPKAGGTHIVNSHSWGSTQTYAWYLEGGPLFLTACQGEGATGPAQVLIGASNIQITGGRYYSNDPVTQQGGIQIGDATHTNIRNTRIVTQIDGVPNGNSVKYSQDGGNTYVHITVALPSGTTAATSGTRHSKSPLPYVIGGALGENNYVVDLDNPKYGIAADGVTDDTAALATALADIRDGCLIRGCHGKTISVGNVVLPNNTDVTWDLRRVTLQARTGSDTAYLLAHTNWVNSTGAVGNPGWTFQGGTFDGNGKVADAVVVMSWDVQFERSKAINATGNGFVITSTQKNNSTISTGTAVQDVKFERCRASGNTGWGFYSRDSTSWINGAQYFGCVAYNNTAGGFYADRTVNFLYDSCHAYTNGAGTGPDANFAQANSGLKVANCSFESGSPTVSTLTIGFIGGGASPVLINNSFTGRVVIVCTSANREVRSVSNNYGNQLILWTTANGAGSNDVAVTIWSEDDFFGATTPYGIAPAGVNPQIIARSSRTQGGSPWNKLLDGPQNGRIGAGISWGTAVPTTGTWVTGDVIWNTAPAAAGAPGWVCTAGGTPGTWKAMAAVAA